jgi:predicted glycoside hydrolase/deacetylase ChbG (UPF0249 family)
MKKRHPLMMLVALFLSLLITNSINSQTRTVAERLGYPPDTKLVIVHADDLGMSHSINEATIKAFSVGLVNSGSIMMPCSWVPEIATYARSTPQADLGLHLTLTSEWKKYRWGPLSSGAAVASLLDADGYFYLTESEAASHANVTEAEREIRLQVDRAAKLGIHPTHLDSHMGTLYQTRDLFEMFVRVAREKKLPIRVSKDMSGRMPFLSQVLKPEDILIDQIISIEPSVSPDGWAQFYTDALKRLTSGVTEIVIHIAYDDAEMKGISFEHPNWGSAWRQRDFEFFTSDAFRKALEENHIKLITWRDLQKLQYGG